MAKVVDELITKYTLDDSDYKRNAKSVLDATNRVGDAVQRTSGLFTSFARGLVAGLTGVAAFRLVKWTVDQAIAFDTMNRSLEAVVGSAERADEILKFVDRLVIPSVFPVAELQNAALLLEAFGLQTERFLPIAEKLGTVFGGTATDLQSFVTALGYIKGGRFGEAFQSLARGGISREALMARGLKFAKDGQLLSTMDEAFDAVEAEVNARFGKLAESMASGPGAKLASLFDQIQRSARIVGQAILQVLVPVVARLGSAFGSLVESGALKSVADTLAGLFNPEAIGDALIRGVAMLQVVMERLPVLIHNARESLASLFERMRDDIILLGSLFIGFLIGPRIIAGLMALEKAILGVAVAIRTMGLMGALAQAIASPRALVTLGAGVAAIQLAETALKGMFKSYTGSLSGLDPRGLGQDIERVYQQMRNDFLEGEGNQAPSNDAPPVRALSKIAENTAQTAENTAKMLDLSRHIFGGGDLGRMGITPVEMGGGSRSSRVTIDVAGAEGPFRLLVETIAMQVMRQMQSAR